MALPMQDDGVHVPPRGYLSTVPLRTVLPTNGSPLGPVGFGKDQQGPSMFSSRVERYLNVFEGLKNGWETSGHDDV